MCVMWEERNEEYLPLANRMTLGEQYKKQVMAVMGQFESDLQKNKEEEEHLRNVIKQLEKTFQQQRVVQSQRMKTIQKLHEQYMKVLESAS